MRQVPSTRRVLAVLRAVVHEVRAERITFMAGSIAYHAFVSLLPLLLLLLAVIATVGDAGLEESFIRTTESVLTPGASEVLVAELRTAEASTGVSVFGGVVLLWGTLRIFRGLDTAFSDIYESESENTFADQLGDSVVVLVTFGLVLLAGLAVESVLPAGGAALAWFVRWPLLVVGLALALAPIYYVFPDEDLEPVEVVPGLLVAAVGLAGFEQLFRLYVDLRGPSGSAVAGILVLLTWLYFSSLVILLGAAVNAVLSNRSEDVTLEPVLGGVEPTAPRAGGRVSEGPDRAALVEDLERLDALLEAADGVTVEVGSASVSLPPPTDATVGGRPGRLVSGPVSLELQWSPRAP